jgi:hypothetical protein
MRLDRHVSASRMHAQDARETGAWERTGRPDVCPSGLMLSAQLTVAVRSFCLSPFSRPALLGLSLFVAACLAGCAGSRDAAVRDLPGQFPNHTALQIRQQIAQPADSVQRFAARARVTIESPQQNGTFNADIRQVRAGSLFMSLSLFGIEGARLLVTPDSAFFYDRRQNRVMAGTVQKAQAMVPIPITSDLMFENMLGLLAPPTTNAWTVEADSALYFVSSPSGRRTFTIDPTRWRVVRYKETTADGTPIEERLFSNFKSVNGVQIPQQILFRRPQDDVMALLRYRSVDLSPSDLSFRLGAGPNVQWVGIPTL